jgi:pseudouridine-5'-phosphate glycosidase
MADPSPLRVTEPVRAAARAGRPIVVLESSVLAQGLPIPSNREAARRMMDAVTGAGAEPAVTAVVRGVPTLGLEPDELERFLAREGVRKVSARDLAAAMVGRQDGATTVAASLALGTLAELPVFATGGIGGVHRQAPGSDPASWVRDESADLLELARSPMLCVCAGAKSILDLPGTLERLETLGVPVVGYRTSTLPASSRWTPGCPFRTASTRRPSWRRSTASTARSAGARRSWSCSRRRPTSRCRASWSSVRSPARWPMPRARGSPELP